MMVCDAPVSTMSPDSAVEMGLWRGPWSQGHRSGGECGGRRGVSRLLGLTQVPLQLRRNREPFGECTKALEKFWPFPETLHLYGHEAHSAYGAKNADESMRASRHRPQ